MNTLSNDQEAAMDGNGNSEASTNALASDRDVTMEGPNRT